MSRARHRTGRYFDDTRGIGRSLRRCFGGPFFRRAVLRSPRLARMPRAFRPTLELVV